MSTVDPITNTEDVIDSRDVINRIEFLTECEESTDPDDELTDEEEAELTALRALDSQGSRYAEDWSHGATLIRDSYFQKYAEELADEVIEDFGSTTSNWPYTCIDWEEAAHELQQDYTNIQFDGVDYWVR